MMTLSADFKDKVHQLTDIRSAVNFDAMEELLAKQTIYFGMKKKELKRDISNMKDRYQTVLKY
jgi:hypothetical protein